MVAKNGTTVDLAGFGSNAKEEGEFMPIYNPGTGEPLMTDDGKAEIGIYLVGRDSKQYREAQRAITNRRLGRKGGAQLTAERLESEANEILAKCTVSWTKGIVFEGAELDFNYHNAKKLYDNLPWLKEQVDEFVSERSNFLGA